jgi:hypothetical protein
MRSPYLALLFSTVAAVGCGGDDDDDGGDNNNPNVDAGTPAECEPTGAFQHYVNNKVTIMETKNGAFDLDGNNRADNQLGGIIGLLKTQGLNIQMTVDEAIAEGSLIMLHSVQAESLTTAASASWEVYLGEPITEPKYDGTDQATVKTDTPADARLCGSIAGGTFEGGPGDVSVQLALGEGDPLTVALKGVRIKGKLTEAGCSEGVLGGGVTNDELNNQVFPAIAELLNNTTNDDHPEGATEPAACAEAGDTCPNTHRGETTQCDAARDLCLQASTIQVLNILDKDNDGQVTDEEIKTNDIIAQALNLDVDLVGNDGVEDSLSVALQFTCVKATFTAPGE